MSGIVFLDVPEDEKDDAKALGAKWSLEARAWYVPAGLSIESFARWFPEAGDELWLSISAPIYAAESVTSCWSCHCKTPVVALAVEEIAGIFEDEEEEERGLILLSDLEEIPDEISRLLGPRYPFLRKGFSETASRGYIINHCSCGTPFEDFFLQAEPDGGFFPQTPEEAAEIVLRELPVSGPFQVKAGFGRIHPDVIGPHARREQFLKVDGA